MINSLLFLIFKSGIGLVFLKQIFFCMIVINVQEHGMSYKKFLRTHLNLYQEMILLNFNNQNKRD